MTPTIEQQLAEVISKADRYAGAKPLAAAIIAAVSNGTLDPIVPAWADEVTIGELTELRALKAKVDGLAPYPRSIVGNERLWFNSAADLLAWLRETTDD